MDYKELKYIYKPSNIAGANTLLLLHGTGGDENDLLPLANNFGTGFNVLSLRGNVSEGGMPRFFKRLGMGIFDEKDLEFRTHEMVAFIKKLAVEKGFDISKIIALGYSNGANIAAATIVLYPDFFAGAILYRPMQPFKVIGADFKNNKHTPVFMSNGASDQTINPGATKQLIEIFKTAGFDVDNQSLPTGHNLSQNDVQLSIDWYNKNFK